MRTCALTRTGLLCPSAKRAAAHACAQAEAGERPLLAQADPPPGAGTTASPRSQDPCCSEKQMLGGGQGVKTKGPEPHRGCNVARILRTSNAVGRPWTLSPEVTAQLGHVLNTDPGSVAHTSGGAGVGRCPPPRGPSAPRGALAFLPGQLLLQHAQGDRQAASEPPWGPRPRSGPQASPRRAAQGLSPQWAAAPWWPGRGRLHHWETTARPSVRVHVCVRAWAAWSARGLTPPPPAPAPFPNPLLVFSHQEHLSPILGSEMADLALQRGSERQ